MLGAETLGADFALQEVFKIPGSFMAFGDGALMGRLGTVQVEVLSIYDSRSVNHDASRNENVPRRTKEALGLLAISGITVFISEFTIDYSTTGSQDKNDRPWRESPEGNVGLLYLAAAEVILREDSR